MSSISDYETKKARLSEQMSRAGTVRLDKTTSNLFRDRQQAAEDVLTVRDFNRVLSVNESEQRANVEGMTTYEDFVDATLQYNLIPAVVPQLKTITIGGAVAGVGIEASSFRYGLVHETVLEMEILLADGTTVICSPEQHSDLFYGFPNSYGTFGYALRLKVKLIPVKPFVKITHKRLTNAAAYFQELAQVCRSEVDFVDGVMFSPQEMYITSGIFVDTAPFTSDYTYQNIYYTSIQEKQIDYLTVHDFLWRWDTDWFWCSKVIHAQNPFVRRLLGRPRLNSKFYTKLMRWEHRWQISKRLNPLFGIHEEWVIQDVDIPIENAPAFADFFSRTIGITPVWICPIGTYNPSAKFNFYNLNPSKLYVNFGFWDSVATNKPAGYYNKLVEAKVAELGGKKGLYSDSYYTQEEFWKMYDRTSYDALKLKYDPKQKLKNLFEKCVNKQ